MNAVRAIPAPVATHIAELLSVHHFDALFAGILALLAPHLATQPRADDDTSPIAVDVVLVRQLSRLFHRNRADGLLAELLDIAGPYLVPPGTVHDTESGPTDANPGGLLTARERDVLVAIAAGYANRAIGRRLHVSEDTVKTYVRRLFRKLSAHDRAHAVARAYQLGYLPVPTLRVAS